MSRDGMREVRVEAPSWRYGVIVGAGVLDRLPALLSERAPAHRYALVSDETVAGLHGRRLTDACVAAGMRTELFTFPAGEAFKTRESWAALTDAMLAAGLGRDACVLAVGGGVTTDLAGFVAATFMRGIPVVQIPTSYLAMIDASIGGKTGVDVPLGKNLVGAFHQPAVVVADPAVLGTLSEAERAQGLVEAFKHGAAFDRSYFDRLQADAPSLLAAEPTAASDAVFRSVELKAHVVGADEREGGFRQTLNLGHTLGHAIEAAAAYRVGHGTAVAAGMLLEAEIGERMGVTESGTSDGLASGLARLRLPPLPELDPEGVLRFLSTDKKARGGRTRYVLLRRLGEADPCGGAWSREVPEGLVRDVLTGFFR